MVIRGGKLGLVICTLCLTALHFSARSQKVVAIDSSLSQHIFTYGEIEVLEDPKASFTFEQVSGPAFDSLFRPSDISTPQSERTMAASWYRVRIKRNPAIRKPFILEFFDQTIDSISAYLPADPAPSTDLDRSPNTATAYTLTRMGAGYGFGNRLLSHKNFELPLDNTDDRTVTLYFRIRSSQPADVIIVIRSVQYFVGYAVTEYFSFGLFYGMILIFSFYNLIMFVAVGQRQYLYYILYILSVGLYEISTDGIAYQYLWPHSPGWNRWAYAFPLLTMSVCALLFTRSLLHVKSRAPRLNKVITAVILARVLFFGYCLLVDRSWFAYKFIEIVPLSLAFYTGIYILIGGYRPARFFVLGYGFLFTGFMLKIFIMLGYSWLNFGVISYYSLSFCFIMEMFFLSFAIGDKVRLLKRKRDKAQRGMIHQMAVNARLQRTLNEELEGQVQERTRQLTQANNLLLEQSREISRMNALLEQDNLQLQTDVRHVSQARALSAPMDFKEFSQIYPDKEACFQFLSDLKWKDGYSCRKCGNDHYFNGHQPFSRRCSKCGDEESVMARTLFQHARIPINKAFYMVFLIYTSKGKISSYALSDIVGIRQSTCWTYLDKVKKLMEERKKELRHGDEQGWSMLVLER